MKLVTLCCFNVGHEGGEVVDPRILTLAGASICPDRRPVEKVNEFGVGLVRDEDRCACTPFIVPKCEEVEQILIFSLIFGI